MDRPATPSTATAFYLLPAGVLIDVGGDAPVYECLVPVIGGQVYVDAEGIIPIHVVTRTS